jgi:hypothetical protein
VDIESANACCYHSVQNHLIQHLLKNLKIKTYKIIILPFVLYGIETWSVTLWEIQRLRMFENRVLRSIFGSKRDEMAGDSGQLHNEDLYVLFANYN